MKTSRLAAALIALSALTLFAADASAYYSPSTGQFLSRDPGPRAGAGGMAAAGRFLPRDADEPDEQYSDGMSLYQYVKSNPVNAVDPDGRKARVTVDEQTCTITVTINIGIYGDKASDALAQKIKKSIESRWNGNNTKRGCKDSDPGSCKVAVVANVKYYKDAKHWPDVHEDNQVKFTGKTKRSWVFGNWGHWEDWEDWAFAHEAGHLMGLWDDYSWISGKPNKGHAGHMMGEYGGVVVQHEVDSILQGKKCPKSCCCPPQSSTK